MTGVLHDLTREITGSVQERRGKWHVVLNLYNDAGIRKPKWIPTGLPVKGNKRKAEKLKDQWIDEHMEKAASPAPTRTLFADFAESWLKGKKAAIEVSTWEKYQNLIENHIAPYFRTKKLAIDEVTPKHIRDYYTYKAEHGRQDRTKGGVLRKGGLAHATLQNHQSVIKLIFDDALILEEVARNPALSVKLTQKVDDQTKEDFSNVVFLNAVQANQVIQAFEGEILQPLVFVCLYYGLRRSEVLGIKWDAIDFEDDSLAIKRTVVKHNTIVEKERTKTKKSKGTYALLPEVRQMLLLIKEQQEANKKLFGKDYVNTDYVFTWPDGRMIRPDYVTHRFQKVLENKGLQKMRFHDLRHSCASVLYDKGWNVKDIQEWLRHSDIETTMNIYTHISNERKRILANDLSNTFTVLPLMQRTQQAV